MGLTGPGQGRRDGRKTDEGRRDGKANEGRRDGKAGRGGQDRRGRAGAGAPPARNAGRSRGGATGGRDARGGQPAGPWQVTGPDARLVDMLGQVIVGLLIGLAALVVIDLIFALLGLGTFGHASGWLAAILPVWLFAEELRAWSGVALRFVLAIVAAAVGLVLGSVVGGAASSLPPLGVGAIGAAVATLSYTLLWYFGVRWLSRRAAGR
jgi:hypothetical protein